MDVLYAALDGVSVSTYLAFLTTILVYFCRHVQLGATGMKREIYKNNQKQ